jgi:hypothetical protein
MRKIFDLDPNLFLDKIHERIAQVTGRLWSASYLWRCLVGNVGYSLQAVTDRVLQRDKEKRRAFLESIELLPCESKSTCVS